MKLEVSFTFVRQAGSGCYLFFGCRSPSCCHLSVGRPGALHSCIDHAIMTCAFFTDSTKTTVVDQREGTSSFVSRFCEPPFSLLPLILHGWALMIRLTDSTLAVAVVLTQGIRTFILNLSAGDVVQLDGFFFAIRCVDG